MRAATLALLSLVMAVPAVAQVPSTDITVPPPPVRTVSLSGPRFGLTSLGDGVVAKLQERSITVGSNISQFGWQFEKEFYGKHGGLAALNEWVFLVGGLDQGVALPSLTWLVGLRSTSGAEFGLGPNVTPIGVALAVAGGVTIRSGSLNVPVTLAVVPSKVGTRVSLLTGFNLRGRR